jgi:hypothetical protein
MNSFSKLVSSYTKDISRLQNLVNNLEEYQKVVPEKKVEKVKKDESSNILYILYIALGILVLLIFFLKEIRANRD